MNLTKQCKQRKLPDGLYWVKHDGVINILDNYEAHLTEVEEVLAKVPSYDEYQKLLSDQLAKNEGEEINAELKELLKECKHIMSIEKDFASCHFEKDKLCKLLTKITQVLGEE